MKPKTRITVVLLLAGGGAVAAGWLYVHKVNEQRELDGKYTSVRKELEVTEATLAEYRRYIDFVGEGRKFIMGQSKFLGAKVVRDYVHMQQLQESVVGIKSDATVVVQYTVEFPVGFDLRPDRFTLSGDERRILVTLGRAELVASPSVQRVTHKIVSGGIFTDEKAAVIAIQQRLPVLAQKQSADILQDPAVVALSEKKLGEFLLDFMRKQPGVKFVPVIEFAYR